MGCRIGFVTEPSAVRLIESARPDHSRRRCFSVLGKEVSQDRLSADGAQSTTTCPPEHERLRVLCLG